MPAPIKRGERYMPGLDGLRAIAVIAVIIYHLGFKWFPGGLLGVGVFFTLSGYLITDILLNQIDKGGIQFKNFWFARARRLFPALFLMLFIVVAWVTVIGPHQPNDFRGSTISAAFYVNNWYLIFHDVSYFAAFGTPQPFNHLWSLSVEEQFYIVWPVAMLGIVKLFPRVEPTTGARFRMAGATIGLALVSMILMIVLYKPGIDPSRVYYGTDTRALELLVGAALAMVWPSRRLHARIKPEARRVIDIAGVLGLVVILAMFLRAQEFAPFLYRGGFMLLSIATAVVVAALAHPASRLGPIVGCKPMRWVGERSYGIYLWHFPIIVLTTPEGAEGVNLARAFLQVAATLLIAALSWKYVEDPIRRGAIGRFRRRIREGRYNAENMTRRGWAFLAGCAAVVIAALLGLAGVGVAETTRTPGDVSVAETKTAEGVEVDEDAANRTICKDVTLIGDSTSEGLVSTEYLPNPQKLIDAQFARVGATTANLEVSGARSIYERFEGLPNAQEVAQSWRDMGFNGCWVLALGTNEAANVSAGSTIGYDERIDSMMSVANGDPVLWVAVKSIVTDGGPYDAANMESWDAALQRACDRYPNMRVYDWPSDVKDQWFIDDGIHFTSQGYAARSRLIADALLSAFPASQADYETGDSSNCVFVPDAEAIEAATAGNVKSGGAAGTTDEGTTTDPGTTTTEPGTETTTTTTDPAVTG